MNKPDCNSCIHLNTGLDDNGIERLLCECGYEPLLDETDHCKNIDYFPNQKKF